jgi:hypothetical protein
MRKLRSDITREELARTPHRAFMYVSGTGRPDCNARRRQPWVVIDPPLPDSRE